MKKVKKSQGTNVSNNIFYGVKWDTEALEGLNNVSRALLNLTELYKSQNIDVTCLKVETCNCKKDK